MLKTRSIFALLLVLVVVTFSSSQVLAQYDNEEANHLEDYSSTPLIQPTIEDFAPAPEPMVDANGNPVAEGPIGVTGYFEVSEQQKVFNITPGYRFTPKFQLKARFPIILERTRTYWDGEESASGLGDIGLDGEFTHQFNSPSKLLRFQGTVKFPTGDNEKIVGDDDVRIPLGTGSLDMMLRGQYTQSDTKYGILASAMFRINATGETVYETVYGDGSTSLETINKSNGNEFVASVFGRYVVGNGIWLNLGASLMMTGNGDSDLQFGDSDPTNSELIQKSTLLDIYPGVSYQFGPVTPYLGARIPVGTSYDNEFLKESRDTAFIFQLTYRPFKMVE